MSKEETYKLNFEINKDEMLKDLKEIKREIKEVTNEIQFDIKKFRLKRKDILVIKVKGIISNQYKQMIEKNLRKELHRKVIVIDETIDNLSILQR